MRRIITAIVFVLATCWAIVCCDRSEQRQTISSGPDPAAALWVAPDSAGIAGLPDASLIRYGRDLIAETSRYFGPRGLLSTAANGMNCQNCHLDAGTRPWGNNYGGVYSTYPKFRERRGGIETVVQRINDCFERSLNGHELDSASREMRAILAYLKWLGTGLARGQKPRGSGLLALPYLDRPADTSRGLSSYNLKCASCHGVSGEGKFDATGIGYQYPPLWGEHSYTTAAGLFRLSRMAGYIKANMPFGVTWKAPSLSDEEAWDLAAYVNSRPRAARAFSKDWPDKTLKPPDQPFGPYSDSFSETQHKFGPYGPIQKLHQPKSK